MGCQAADEEDEGAGYSHAAECPRLRFLRVRDERLRKAVVNYPDLLSRHTQLLLNRLLRELGDGDNSCRMFNSRSEHQPRIRVREPVGKKLAIKQMSKIMNRNNQLAGVEARNVIVRTVEQVIVSR